MKKTKTTPKEPLFKYNATQLKVWKENHKEVHAVDVIGDNDELIRGIFKKPDLNIIMAADAIGDDILKRAVFSFENCWIDGDQRLKDNEDLKVSAGIQVYNLFKIHASIITKL
jgi:hypothetical protein